MKWTKEQIDIQGDAAECRGLGGYLMGRTKRRHRAWKQQMRSRARKRRGYGYRWDDDISPGRLVAWAEPETPKNFCSTEMENHVNGGRPAQCK